MNLPDSIKKITEEKSNDPFIVSSSNAPINIDNVIYNIKQNITPEYLKYFDEGAAYYISGNTERNLIRGILSLYSDVVVKLLRKSNIDDTFKNTIISNFENTTKTIAQLFDYQLVMINNLTPNKKVIDVIELSYIMLGYAIETIRKLHNAKSQ